MKFNPQSILLVLLTATACWVPAHAGLFDDEEARKAILDLRARVEALNGRIDSKADRSSSLDLSGQNEQLRQEIARLRGQVEVLANDLANEQRRQKDFYTDLDNRLRKLEPQKANVDGKEVLVDQSEQSNYEAALATFRAGDYKNANAAFTNFLQRYPRSGLAGSVYYWLGNTYYAQRDYRNAIISHQTVVKNFPDNPRVPDSMLNIASCQTELKDKAAAKKTLEALVTQFPDTPAAQTAKERLAAWK